MSGRSPDPTACSDVAAYALGALSYEESQSFRRHLDDCGLCRTDLAALQPAVDALPLSVESVAPPPELRRRIMGVVEADVRERRRAARRERSWVFGLRPLPALAAACVALVLGVVVGQATLGEDARTVRGDVLNLGARGATVELEVGDDGGKLVVDRMPQPPLGRVYQVWLKRRGEAPKPTDAMFTVARDGSGSVAVPGRLRGVKEVLVTHEPRGGSTTPTSAPDIRVEL